MYCQVLSRGFFTEMRTFFWRKRCDKPRHLLSEIRQHRLRVVYISKPDRKNIQYHYISRGDLLKDDKIAAYSDQKAEPVLYGVGPDELFYAHVSSDLGPEKAIERLYGIKVDGTVKSGWSHGILWCDNRRRVHRTIDRNIAHIRSHL